jgi:antitoxin (DNA-binding transcriptional repressor) of toxin-antitoxin stability system
MKAIGIREFRDKATHYLAAKEAVAIKRHNKVVGFYIPVQASEEAEIKAALAKLELAIDKSLLESGLDEESLSQILNLSTAEG